VRLLLPVPAAAASAALSSVCVVESPLRLAAL